MGGIDTSNSSNNTFPAASGAFGAHTSGRRIAFNTAFNDSTESSGGSDESDKTNAYVGAFFFKKGGIDQVLAESTTSAKPLKITGQVIDKFSGDITHWPLFREQFVKLAHRPGNFRDDIERFYFLLSQVDILRATYGDKGHSSGGDATKTRTAVAFRPRNNGPPRSSTRPTKTSVTAMCVFCPSRDQWGSNCTKFATISDRIRRITELKKCYYCLNDHLADVCDNPAARMCRHCHNEKHHICFCRERNRNGRQTSRTHSAKLEPVYQDLNEPSSGRYEVGLPWRTSDGQPPSSEELSDNFKYAFACLQALVKTLSKENLLAEYNKIFQEYLASGIISEFESRPSHYLSHHAVIKRSSTTTKTRPVFNGIAKPDKTSPSMNDMLHKGPVLLNPITAVLLNSRLASYVRSSDIAKAFLQVALRPDEKRFCCFLWVRDLSRPATGDNMVTYCFNRVIFGLRPSPALLAVFIEKHMRTLDTPLSREILANCYVDNIYLTADDLEQEDLRRHEHEFAGIRYKRPGF
ncbi:Pao retrotransposon peptidase family protein [Aphelenchoides avenae]|nr:Pao retrotransposon peptidase family protein [Aphelenchus avenae]